MVDGHCVGEAGLREGEDDFGTGGAAVEEYGLVDDVFAPHIRGIGDDVLGVVEVHVEEPGCHLRADALGIVGWWRAHCTDCGGPVAASERGAG